MARTTSPRDGNRVAGMIAASNDAFEVPVILWADPDTHRLLVDSNVGTGVIDGEAIDAADFGQIFLGSDGSNYQVVKTDSDGNLQVDILSGGGAGVQYTEGDTDASITGTALMLEGAANTLVAAPGTAADGMLVNLGTNNDVTVTGDALTALQAIDTDATTIIGHLDGVEGLLTTIDADTGAIATSVASIDTKTPALGQALAAASVPVILPAATITTLTPPAAITGFATETKQDTIIGHVDGIEALLTTIDADTSGIITAVQLIDNLVLAEDAAHQTGDPGIQMLAVRDDTLDARSGTENDYEPLHTNANGALWVIDVNSATALTALQNIDTDATTIIGHLDGVEGLLTTIDADTSGMVVSLALMDDWDNAASDGASVSGDVANDAADAGEPVKIGGRAQEPTAQLEEVSADNDRVDAAFDRQGRLATWNGYPVQSAVINNSTSGDNTIVSAAGAGLRIAVIGCVIISDGTTDVRWEDGASGTAKTGQMPLQAREGFVMPIGNQPWFVGTANTLLNLELTAAVNVHGIVSYVTMQD